MGGWRALGERRPAFAAVSASSFPWWPLWAGTYVKEMGKGRIFDREYILWMVESVLAHGLVRFMRVAWLSR